jgi:vancomycin resistance protein YoaR
MTRLTRASAANAGGAAAAILLVLVGGALFTRLAAAPPPEVEMAGYAPNLLGRTESQRHNARLAAEAINGRIIPPAHVFSFNETVKAWSVDAGYVKAPVSYDGELLRAFGGGVCQTSTTLYNAALLAGLPIVERHPHVFAAHYVPPGHDAAVAHPSIDLRIKNPYPWPIRIQASARNDRLSVKLFGARKPDAQVEVIGDMLTVDAPARYTLSVSGEAARGRRFVRTPGAAGCRVVTYRIFSKNGKEIRRERLSDDSYESMDRVTQIVEGD